MVAEANGSLVYIFLTILFNYKLKYFVFFFEQHTNVLVSRITV